MSVQAVWRRALLLHEYFPIKLCGPPHEHETADFLFENQAAFTIVWDSQQMSDSMSVQKHKFT